MAAILGAASAAVTETGRNDHRPGRACYLIDATVILLLHSAVGQETAPATRCEHSPATVGAAPRARLSILRLLQRGDRPHGPSPPDTLLANTVRTQRLCAASQDYTD